MDQYITIFRFSVFFCDNLFLVLLELGKIQDNSLFSNWVYITQIWNGRKKCPSRNKVLLFQIICHEFFSFFGLSRATTSDSMCYNFSNSKPWAWKDRERKCHFTKCLPRKILCSYSFWMSTAHWVKAISAGRIINWPKWIWSRNLGHGHLSLIKNVMVLNREGVFDRTSHVL